ncbi:MAG: K(+)-transporting ATPase subunit F [Verrucomicrobia bacterium]|nr:K(+)-transporting ATPase subunit F [Verrucomicrobiota bacterium]
MTYTVILGIVSFCLLLYLFATIIWPEKF